MAGIDETPPDFQLDPEAFIHSLLASDHDGSNEAGDRLGAKAMLPGDDDPDVVEGMERLRRLREAERDVPELRTSRRGED